MADRIIDEIAERRSRTAARLHRGTGSGETYLADLRNKLYRDAASLKFDSAGGHAWGTLIAPPPVAPVTVTLAANDGFQQVGVGTGIEQAMQVHPAVADLVQHGEHHPQGPLLRVRA